MSDDLPVYSIKIQVVKNGYIITVNERETDGVLAVYSKARDYQLIVRSLDELTTIVLGILTREPD